VREQKPRQIAWRVLSAAPAGGEFLESRLDRELAGVRLSRPDRALCQELVYGVTRWRRALDWLIGQKTARLPKRPGVAVLLRLGLYQMFWLSRIPDHAAVHETVELAKALGFHAEAGFLNALLRGYAREREPAIARLGRLRMEEPGLGYSHPDWLCARWRERWGGGNLAALLEWNNSPAPVFARVNTLKTAAEPLTQAWTAEGVVWREAVFDWTGPGLLYQIEFPPPLTQLPSFQAGGFYVQDPSTLLAVKELEPRAGERVLDLCAAPGGKTTFAAQLMLNQGRVLACDESQLRLGLLRENCARLGVSCVETALAADVPGGADPLEFDRVLVDAPCSNTGVLRRRVEARWRVTPGEIERLRKAQLVLLRQAAPRVRPGGRLVYSTCSLEPEENEDLVRAFLSERADFQLIRQRTLLPFRDGVDGAFAAVMERTKDNLELISHLLEEGSL
jgi:16S rRNA (cytosine967-C5)-methyltransferase